MFLGQNNELNEDKSWRQFVRKRFNFKTDKSGNKNKFERKVRNCVFNKFVSN